MDWYSPQESAHTSGQNWRHLLAWRQRLAAPPVIRRFVFVAICFRFVLAFVSFMSSGLNPRISIVHFCLSNAHQFLINHPQRIFGCRRRLYECIFTGLLLRCLLDTMHALLTRNIEGFKLTRLSHSRDLLTRNVDGVESNCISINTIIIRRID